MATPYTPEQVLGLLSISPKAKGNELVIRCPIQGCTDTSTHMSINKATGQVYCLHCNWRGNILTLFATMQGMNSKEAYAVILKALGIWNESDMEGSISKIQKLKEENRERAIKLAPSPLLPMNDLSMTYWELLGNLSLSNEHTLSLKERGFEDYFINVREYKSAPVNDYHLLLPDKMAMNGVSLEGVPGFHKNEKGKWEFIKCRPGIFVPVRDNEGRIRGIQHRIDEDARRIKDGKKESKYKWVSSQSWEGYTNGCGPQGVVHWACEYDFSPRLRKDHPRLNRSDEDGKYIGLTEGPMKADLFFQLSGVPTIAVPGINVQDHLVSALKEAKAIGVTKVFGLLDMDYESNENVRNACERIVQSVTSTGLIYQRLTWDKEFNGIDDYYAFKTKGIRR